MNQTIIRNPLAYDSRYTDLSRKGCYYNYESYPGKTDRNRAVGKRRINRKKRILSFAIQNRKLLLTASLIILFVSILFFGGIAEENEANASTVQEKYFTCINIEEGDTLWGIASEYASVEFGSYDAFIDEVKRINNLKGDSITSGATLVIPVYK